MPKPSKPLKGRYTRHPDGYGFVELERSQGADVFIPPERAGEAIHGDRVLVRIVTGRAPGRGGRRTREKARPDRLEGEIVRVIERPGIPIVGRIRRYRRRLYLTPLDQRYAFDVLLVEDSDEPAWEDCLAAVRLIGDPSRGDRPMGRLIEVLGREDDPGIEYKIVCFSHDIPLRFPQEVIDQAAGMEAPAAQERCGRLDLRSCCIITIDGESAQDFDDAVGLERRADGGYRLGVHIADVGHYVSLDSPIDCEALRRGTSVYFPDRAVPMLPPRLSNQLCSLKPGEDRLTVSIFLEFDGRGARTGVELAESVIRSRERMTYSQVHRILTGEDSAEPYQAGRSASQAEPGASQLRPMLEAMLELSRLLRRRRMARGALDLDLPEAEVSFDGKGRVRDVRKAPRWESHRLIEEFMLAANEAVAERLFSQGVPLLFRIHEDPDPDKVDRFLDLAKQYGHSPGPRGAGRAFAGLPELLERLSGMPEEPFLAKLLLRSLQQARYSDINSGHFGLASKLYTHFTSPIRRYPDLVVHRILKTVLAGRHKTASARHYYRKLEEIARLASQRERLALEAERTIVKWLCAEFMGRRLGDEFEARITGVKPSGFFVELERPFVEGFVSVQTLHDDYYGFKPRTQALVGERRRRTFRLGDSVRVRVDRVDRRRRQIDFSLAS